MKLVILVEIFMYPSQYDLSVLGFQKTPLTTLPILILVSIMHSKYVLLYTTKNYLYMKHQFSLPIPM